MPPPHLHPHLHKKGANKEKDAEEQETPEYCKQKAICEHHKKIAFDTARRMIEEELKLFRSSDSTDTEQELVSNKYTFAKTCLQQNFFSCILE